MADTTDIKKEKLLKALEKSLGIVSHACKAAKVCRDSHYRWLKEDKEYKKKVDDLSNLALDLAESKLHKQIQESNLTAIIFFLKCKGKERGYIEKNEISIPDGITITVNEKGIS